MPKLLGLEQRAWTLLQVAGKFSLLANIKAKLGLMAAL